MFNFTSNSNIYYIYLLTYVFEGNYIIWILIDDNAFYFSFHFYTLRNDDYFFYHCAYYVLYVFHHVLNNVAYHNVLTHNCDYYIDLWILSENFYKICVSYLNDLETEIGFYYDAYQTDIYDFVYVYDESLYFLKYVENQIYFLIYRFHIVGL